MRVNLRTGTHSNQIYAFKDRVTGQYISAIWSKDPVKGTERCVGHKLVSDITGICKDAGRAKVRFNIMLELLRQELDSVLYRNPPSRWRSRNGDLLARLLGGDLVLVLVESTVSVTETEV